MANIGRAFAFVMAARRGYQDFDQARSWVNGCYIGSRLDPDDEFSRWLGTQASGYDYTASAGKSDQLKMLEDRWSSWVTQHKYNVLKNLNAYQPDFSQGTTQAFDSFYLRHRNRRFRCLIGEYFYHIKVWQTHGLSWTWTDLTDLKPGDALVISVPFCDTAKKPPGLDAALMRCDELGIPVLLDLCYWPISFGIELDLNHECIDTVAFSLSKAWPVSTARIGMRYTRPESYDGQKLHHDIGYNNNLGAFLGNVILDNFSIDRLVDRCQSRYHTICDALSLEPTNSVVFGLGNDSWNIYSRRELLRNYGLKFDDRMFVNRICLNRIYSDWDLFQTYLQHESTPGI